MDGIGAGDWVEIKDGCKLPKENVYVLISVVIKLISNGVLFPFTMFGFYANGQWMFPEGIPFSGKGIDWKPYAWKHIEYPKPMEIVKDGASVV